MVASTRRPGRRPARDGGPSPPCAADACRGGAPGPAPPLQQPVLSQELTSVRGELGGHPVPGGGRRDRLAAHRRAASSTASSSRTSGSRGSRPSGSDALRGAAPAPATPSLEQHHRQVRLGIHLGGAPGLSPQAAVPGLVRQLVHPDRLAVTCESLDEGCEQSRCAVRRCARTSAHPRSSPPPTGTHRQVTTTSWLREAPRSWRAAAWRRVGRLRTAPRSHGSRTPALRGCGARRRRRPGRRGP